MIRLVVRDRGTPSGSDGASWGALLEPGRPMQPVEASKADRRNRT